MSQQGRRRIRRRLRSNHEVIMIRRVFCTLFAIWLGGRTVASTEFRVSSRGWSGDVGTTLLMRGASAVAGHCSAGFAGYQQRGSGVVSVPPILNAFGKPTGANQSPVEVGAVFKQECVNTEPPPPR